MTKNVFHTLLELFEDDFGNVKQKKLAEAIGTSPANISNWKNGKSSPQKNQLEKMLKFFMDYHASRLIQPLVIYRLIIPNKNKKGKWVFDDASIEVLRDKVDKKTGVYLFYDSSGKTIYLGKSSKNLFTELKQQLNTTTNRPFYNPKKMKENPKVGHYARYVSVFDVKSENAIHNIEAFMLLAFANDTYNKHSANVKKMTP